MSEQEKPEWLKGHKGGQRGWLPGESGNPSGRPKGSKNRKTLLSEEFEKEGSAIGRVVMDKALAGDMVAANIVLQRLSPPLRSRAEKVVFELTSDAPLTVQAQQILVAVSNGEVDPDTGQVLINCISSFAGLKQIDEIARRIEALEAK